MVCNFVWIWQGLRVGHPVTCLIGFFSVCKLNRNQQSFILKYWVGLVAIVTAFSCGFVCGVQCTLQMAAERYYVTSATQWVPFGNRQHQKLNSFYYYYFQFKSCTLFVCNCLQFHWKHNIYKAQKLSACVCAAFSSGVNGWRCGWVQLKCSYSQLKLTQLNFPL